VEAAAGVDDAYTLLQGARLFVTVVGDHPETSMPTTQFVLDRAHAATGNAILYSIGEGGKDPAAALPSNPVRVAEKWAEMNPAQQRDFGPVAQAMGIDVHDPSAMRQACDCSGFVCWALDLPRSMPGPDGAQLWNNTDGIWADAKGPQTHFQELSQARPGALVVYPKAGSNENFGHVAIVMEVDAAGIATRIAHCSADNNKDAPYDSIKITGPAKFKAQKQSVYAWPRNVAG
jgi:hypothetical protein